MQVSSWKTHTPDQIVTLPNAFTGAACVPVAASTATPQATSTTQPGATVTTKPGTTTVSQSTQNPTAATNTTQKQTIAAPAGNNSDAAHVQSISALLVVFAFVIVMLI